MKSFPTILAFVAICATSYALTAKPVPTQTASRQEVRNALRAIPIDISIDALSLPIKNRSEFKESRIPSEIRKLVGRRVRMIGQMFPEFEETGLKQFTFNGDTSKRTHRIHDAELVPVEIFIPVIIREGNAANFTFDPIEVEGRLNIKPHYLNGLLIHLYEIEDATIHSAEREEGFRPSVNIFGC